jgi:peptidyl-prolyl cis-trans isomerase SurA
MKLIDLRALAILSLVCLGVAPNFQMGAHAQSAVAVVNGEPITARDVDQRMRVQSQLFRQPLSRPAAIQELIDDKVKLAEGRRQGMRVTDAHMEDMMGGLAQRARQTPVQFEQNLLKAAIDPASVRAKITSETIWSELLRQRARSRNVSNAELNAEMDRRAAKGEATVTDYVLRQVVFVVPSGTSPGVRERDAAAARGRFTDCDTGVEAMRALRDVAVKERISRSSNELSNQLTELLAKTPVGRLTAPYRTEQGIEMVAVCEKSERQDNISLRSKIEREMQEKSLQGTSASYLAELRAKVEIRR